MARVRLEVTEEILDRVIFGMENQIEILYLDPCDGILKPKGDDEMHHIPLPPWGSTEGYRLMDRFSASMSGLTAARQIQDILASGSRVFRRFKSFLAERPELEKLWRRFKHREMRKIAISWLNRWSDALALESLGDEPEDWDDIVPSDFSVRPARPADMPDVERLFSLSMDRESCMEFKMPSEELLVAETPAGELAGFAWIHLESSDNRGELLQLHVLPDYRGLGVGRLLADLSCAEMLSRGAKRLSVSVPRTGQVLNSWLERNGFRHEVVIWGKSLDGA
ncbi:MAG: hypothetical protein B6D68_00935 [spirochete symbiont of Stewartia floridana]|nr:MAG: hypothetical protein B6D68_00935 [spirochete symbiont of Stewartia floridana]